MLPGGIGGVIRIELPAGNTRVHAANSEGKEPFTIRSGQPGNPLTLLDRKRFSGRRSGWYGSPARGEREEQDARDREPDGVGDPVFHPSGSAAGITVAGESGPAR